MSEYTIGGILALIGALVIAFGTVADLLRTKRLGLLGVGLVFLCLAFAVVCLGFVW